VKCVRWLEVTDQFSAYLFRVHYFDEVPGSAWVMEVVCSSPGSQASAVHLSRIKHNVVALSCFCILTINLECCVNSRNVQLSARW
jgi:hypothetical protein